MAGDEVEMKDAPSTDAMDVDPKPMESIENDPTQEDAEEDNEPDAGSDAEDGEGSGRPVSNHQYKELKRITDVLSNYKIKLKHRNVEDEHFPANLFRRLPNKRNLPDYYTVIARPSALSTLKGKIQRKQYTGIPEFVEDFALIVHNAQVYNRPNSGPVRDVLRLDAVFKEEMKKLVEQGLIKEEETVYPDLGEIPDATPEPDPVSEDEEDVDDEQDEDEEDEGDESDEERRKKRGRRARNSIGGKKLDKDDDEDNEKAGDAEQKRRGRPPKVDTPVEARIKAILKGIRKYKNEQGHTLVYDFEKLPDKAEHLAYYTVISNPVALDGIKKKAKRKKYETVDQFMKDVTIMFENALLYNEDGSEIHTNAQELLRESQRLAQVEKDKPDSEYLMQDGRLPLPYINHDGKVWRVGDWVHVHNINDVTKPIPAQIYRTWQDSDGRKWINACWYYRPEQTVHQYEKHFFPHEVVKTGQYRDHPIEELLDKCFVMFFTRFGKGRPRGLDPNQEVYVCESRYNEEKFKFNKIKTWASCLPDEVRDKDYEMDLFDVPKKVKKIPSPLVYLVDKGAKEDQDIPQPVWGAQNAPPKQGAIYKRPRDENQSPPPEPTPPPPPTPPPVVRQPSANLMPQHQVPPGSLLRQGSNAGIAPGQMTRPSPSVIPQTPYQPGAATPTPQYNRPSYSAGGPAPPSYGNNQAQTPQPGSSLPYANQQPAQPPVGYGASHPGAYGAGNTASTYSRPPLPNYPTAQELGIQRVNVQASNYPGFEGRSPDVYILSDAANESIPKEIRDLYPQDESGHVLFFTQPPLVTRRHIQDLKDARGRDQPLQHTERYINSDWVKHQRTKLLAKTDQEDVKDTRPASVTTTQNNTTVKVGDKRKRLGHDGDVDYDAAKTPVAVKESLVAAAEKPMTKEERLALIDKMKSITLERMKANGPVTENYWTGQFLDDYDPRLPPFN